MATTPNANVFGTNDWQKIYKTFSQADFSSYDAETLKKSFIEYLKTYYPENFNDYTQGSEYMALLNVIAFMGQSLAFRHDLNTRENFIELAEKRDSVIKLASLVNYTPKRNQCAQGVLKISSIRTTEDVFDLNGYNLNGQTIIWNDPANQNWFEQFCSIVNASLVSSQKFGKPGNSKTILNIKTDEYAIQLPATTLPIKAFESKVQGVKQRFELVSVSSVNSDNLQEVNPKPSSTFNILYRNDKLGYASANTGFFVYFKQGQLFTKDFSITEQTQNQLIDINQNNINDSDVWLFQIDPIDSSSLQEWTKVDNVYSANQGSTTRTLFSVKSRANDQISLKFGDGVFSDLPSGKFRVAYRVSNGNSYQIAINEIQGVQVSFDYIDANDVQQKLTLQLSLQLPVSNALPAESIDDIKQRAPTQFYSQNRMVNGEDYNLLPFTQYNSILKTKAINRASIGVSRSKDLLDPTGKYSNHTLFATDGGIFKLDDTETLNVTFSDVTDLAKFFTEDLKKLLATPKTIQWYQANAARYDLSLTEGSDTDSKIYWKTGSVQSNYFTTGYLFDYIGSDENLIENPLAVGNYSDNNLKYVGQNALIKIVAPEGYYFDVDTNRLQQGTITNVKNGKLYYWTTVTNVVEDGYNNGQGLLSTGEGPITLSDYVPSGAIVAQIIPSFDNTFGTSLIQNIIARMNLQRDFALKFNNSLALSLERWHVVATSSTDWFFKFTCQSSGSYLVEYLSLKYVFSSVNETRFTFNNDQIVYDRNTGQILNDYIKVLRTNLDPDIPTTSLNQDIVLTCVGQTIETDGYTNDFQIEVSAINPKNKQFTSDPDFFSKLIGIPSKKWVFLKTSTDPQLLTRTQMIATSEVVSDFATLIQIERNKYDYPPNQIYYATNEDKFYIAEQDTTVSTSLVVSETTDYSVRIGRQPLSFQYQHYANQNVRVNPSTSNIIDVYVVLKTYYQNYKNWLRDQTGKVSEPSPPSTYQLMTEFSKLNTYKTSSDELILNSVKFKPLFGTKASANLQAKIKVTKLKSSTASDSEIKSAVIAVIDEFFSIEKWDFGQTFYFSELSAYLHTKLSTMISSAIIVPVQNNKRFGELYEIRAMPFEIFTSAAQVTDIDIVDTLSPSDFKNT